MARGAKAARLDESDESTRTRRGRDADVGSSARADLHDPRLVAVVTLVVDDFTLLEVTDVDLARGGLDLRVAHVGEERHGAHELAVFCKVLGHLRRGCIVQCLALIKDLEIGNRLDDRVDSRSSVLHANTERPRQGATKGAPLARVDRLATLLRSTLQCACHVRQCVGHKVERPGHSSSHAGDEIGQAAGGSGCSFYHAELANL